MRTGDGLQTRFAGLARTVTSVLPDRHRGGYPLSTMTVTCLIIATNTFG
ncbi:MAG: hypothetical protein ABFS21_06630 [Actinomycetota bacterium]